jgi:membrane dipeptidase
MLKDLLLIDAHCDTLLRLLHRPELDFADRLTPEQGHIDLPRMREGGVSLQFFACYIEPQYKPTRSTRRALQVIDKFYEVVDQNADNMMMVKSVADLEQARSLGKIGALLSIEGGEAIEGDLGVLRMLYKLGVRAIGLTWNERNDIADGVGDDGSRGGLSTFGKSVVKEMTRLGMLVDVSHLSDPGFYDVAEAVPGPFVATHSNSRAVCNHRRNLTDDQIKVLAQHRGVMGMNFSCGFVAEGRRPSTDDLIAHIDRISDLAGPGIIGLGSDYDGIGCTPEGLEDCSAFPKLADALARRGYKEKDIRGIFGENFLRVIREVVG